MYAFTPKQCDSQLECFVELSRPYYAPPYGIQTAPRGNWHLNQYQTREVFNIACKALRVHTPYAIEQRLAGESFLPDERSRWWEKLSCGRLDLVRALSRKDPAAQMWMNLLSQHTKEADTLLAMPLWKLSGIGGASVNTVLTWRRSVEAMGVQIPQFPRKSEISSLRYTKRLLEALKDPETMWAGLNVAIFCLRLAQAQGNLAHYILTYETIIDERWSACQRDISELGNLLRFYAEWFSLLQLHILTEADLVEIEKDLTGRFQV